MPHGLDWSNGWSGRSRVCAPSLVARQGAAHRSNPLFVRKNAVALRSTGRVATKAKPGNELPVVRGLRRTSAQPNWATTVALDSVERRVRVVGLVQLAGLPWLRALWQPRSGSGWAGSEKLAVLREHQTARGAEGLRFGALFPGPRDARRDGGHMPHAQCGGVGLCHLAGRVTFSSIRPSFPKVNPRPSGRNTGAGQNVSPQLTCLLMLVKGIPAS
jgi:hypothetical protein